MARSPVGARLVAAMAAIAALAAPAAAQAPTPHVDVGIGEQNPTLFDDPRFQTTGIRHAWRGRTPGSRRPSFAGSSRS